MRRGNHRGDSARFVAALSLLWVTLGCAAIVLVIASYVPSARDLLTVPLNVPAVVLASAAVSLVSAVLLFSSVPLENHHRLWVFASAVVMLLLNVACGYIMVLFWLAPPWPLWRFYRQATATVGT
jgi:hypothetical protein